MAITEGTLLRVSLSGLIYNQLVMNVWTYEVGGTFSGIEAGAVANAWWQRVKTPYRALVGTAFGAVFSKVIVADMENPLGDYGEYAVPVAERSGTRSNGSENGMPGFVAAGVRLSVATRVTRPGQKRFPWLMENDSAGSGLESGFSTLVATLMDAATVNVTLGAPALGMDLNPVVVRLDPATGLPVAYQPVVGYSINTSTTSQVSRKIGRGA
jgi:hypothetical protein